LARRIFQLHIYIYIYLKNISGNFVKRKFWENVIFIEAVYGKTPRHGIKNGKRKLTALFSSDVFTFIFVCLLPSIITRAQTPTARYVGIFRGVCSIVLRVDRSMNKMYKPRAIFTIKSLLQKVCNYLLLIFFMFTAFLRN
jgi:hypothetical protein